MKRSAFDEILDVFRETLQAAIRDAAPRPCPFLHEQLEMIRSMRYRDRLFADIRHMLACIRPGARALDFGTGSGIVATLLAANEVDVDGIDIATFHENDFHAHMAEEQARVWERLSRRFRNLRFQHYSGTRVPFESGTFDLVAAYGVIEHIAEPILDDVMESLARSTRVGGYLAIGYLPRKWAWLEVALRGMGRWHHVRRWGDREIRRFLVKHGYTVRSFERVIFAPQFPPDFANRWKPWFDRLDALARIPPFSVLARDVVLLAQREGSS